MQKSTLCRFYRASSTKSGQFKVQNDLSVKILHFTLSFFILIFTFLILAASVAHASETNGTIISGGNVGYAWSNQAGWVNFAATNSNIQISDSAITGYAWNSNYGWINMSPSNGGIAIAANGALSGYVWGSSLGWINFSGVSINSSGKFTGQASSTIIGTLTFDCANCDVRTDYRPANFRTTTSPSTSPGSSSRGGGGISGAGGISVPPPSVISASNVPLTITPSQSGTLTQNFSNNKKVELRVERGAATQPITFTIGEQTAQVSISSLTSVVGGATFDIQAFFTETGERVRSFAQPIRIALTVPESLQGRSDLGVYFLNEDVNAWEKISDVTFAGTSATFFVDHLTLFGIFSSSNLPAFIQPFFAIPTAPVPGATSSGTAVELTEEALPAQLFDIRLLVDSANVSRIIDLVARVTFESFGRVPTPVEMTFSIIDADGNELWKSSDTTTVETSAVFVKRFFDAPVLGSGSYVLKLHTLYNTDVEDDFGATFTIEPEGTGWNWVPWFVSGLFLILLLLVLAWWLIRRRREDQEKKGFYTPFT